MNKRAQCDSVLMLTPDREIDRRILLEAEALRADGWTVKIVAMPVDGVAVSDPSWVVRARASAGGAKKEKAVLGVYRMLRGWLPMNGPAMRRLKSFVWSTIANPESFYTKIFASTIADESPSIIVAHDLPMLPSARSIADRCGAQLIYDSHELWCEKGFPPRWKRAWRAVEEKHIGRCDAVITINHSIATLLKERYGLRRVDVITNATSPMSGEAKDLRAACRIDRAARVLLYQGGLTSGRQIEQVVAAMALVKNNQVHLVLLGSGALKRQLMRRAIRSGAAARIHFLDAVPQTELLAWSASADVGVIPYGSDCLNNHLCTPNKLYEFIAAGLPILANDLPELRRAVAENEFGLVREMRNPRAIASAIEECFADASRIAQWRSSLVRRQHEFAWLAEAEKYKAIIRRVAANAPAAALPAREG